MKVTGGGKSTAPDLTTLDEKVAALIGNTAIDGIPNAVDAANEKVRYEIVACKLTACF